MELACRIKPLRWLRYYVLRFKRQPGSDHSLALGVAIGVFAGCLPFFPGIPVHSAIAIPLAMLLGGNKLAAFLSTNIDNPANMAFFWWMQHEVGRRVLGWDVRLDPQAMDSGQLVAAGGKTLAMMFAGGAVVGFCLGIIAYFCSRPLIGMARSRRKTQLRRRRMELAARLVQDRKPGSGIPDGDRP